MTHRTGHADVVPLSRLTWQTQAVLDVLLDDPEREVWPGLVDRHWRRTARSAPILKRLNHLGWLEVRQEPDGDDGTPGRVLYRLTAGGERLAREAVGQTVAWPARVDRRCPEMEPLYLETVEYPRGLITYVLAVALDEQAEPLKLVRQMLPPDRLFPAAGPEAAVLALRMLGTRPGGGVEETVTALFDGG